MSASASTRSRATQLPAPVRRLGDVLGVGTAGTVGTAACVVAVLGALVAIGQPVAAGLVLLALVVAVVVAVVVVVVRVLQPVRVLAGEVEGAARETLPAADPPVDQAPDGTSAVRGPADVVALAGAVTSLRAAATSLVAAEHDRHRRTCDLTAHLARRNHGLVDRLVTQIGELESAERSPTVLAQLARLKHTAVRTRRHAESMLVLTGGLPDRSRPRPAALADVLHGALAGIEDHVRVATGDVEPAAVSGSVVADLAHLLAELVENAAQFSPPETRITVTGAPAPGAAGYRIRVADRGVGMTADQLDAANGRIRHAASSAQTARQTAQQPVKLIGLDVVGRLAGRHGITVTLEHDTDGGVAAIVTLPDRLLVPLADLPAPRRPVSALVAAAAFRPPPASVGEPSPSDDDAGAGEPDRPQAVPADAAAAAPELVRPGVPRRVRGAQLPNLGPDRTNGPHVTPDAGRVHGRLHALQSGLSAARTDNIPPLPRQLPASRAPRDEPDRPSQAPGRAPDGDD